VVVDGFGTKSSALRAAIDALKTTQVRVVGVIINKLKRVRFGYAYGYPYYYDYYYYRYYASDVDGALANGRGPIYKRPVNWARSALSKLRRP
jgi:Mrp family chromosome partitioning ATPase